MQNKDIFVFGFGAICGGITTYFIVKGRLKAQNDAELDEMRQYYDKKMETSTENEVVSGDDINRLESSAKPGPDLSNWKSPKTIIDSNNTIKNSQESQVEERMASGERINYNEIIDKLNNGEYSNEDSEDEELDEDDICDIKAKIAPVEKQDKPFVITYDEYCENNGYSKETISYYEDDETFVDDKDEMLDNAFYLIGENNLDRFGEEEDDTMYIRNDSVGVDYCVVLEHSAYSESIGM